jgi:hypothetical protein
MIGNTALFEIKGRRTGGLRGRGVCIILRAGGVIQTLDINKM